MKFKAAFFLLIFVFSFVTSCRTSRQVVQKNETLQETVRELVVTYKDTTLFTPVSKTQLKLPISSLPVIVDLNTDKTVFKPQTYSQKNGNATVKVQIGRAHV